jgi:hypothetical protein
MIRTCAAVRKKGSAEKCSCRVVEGSSLCHRHVRSKTVTLWSEQFNASNIIKIQAFIRGWILRKYLKLCGPGVLKRSILTNDEELVSCESKNELYPFEFFSFEEAGKIWWFDFDTIWKWCVRSRTPENPYTKVPLTVATRKRLRQLWAYRKLHGMFVPIESNVYGERVEGRWNIICQVLEDNGFIDIHPNIFSRMNRRDYHVVSQFVIEDIRVSLPKTHSYYNLFLKFLTRLIHASSSVNAVQYILQSTQLYMLMLCLPKDPYILAFTLMSGLYRM